MYQEPPIRTRPDFVVETGTWRVAGALYFATLFDHPGHGRVVTVDVDVHPNRPYHTRITYVTGSTLDAAVVKKEVIRAFLKLSCQRFGRPGGCSKVHGLGEQPLTRPKSKEVGFDRGSNL